MRKLKIILSVSCVLLVAFFVARGCVPKKAPRLLPSAKPVKVKYVKPARAKGAVMAIVLDDWGQNLALVDDAIAIGRPLTLAVLPNLPHSRQIAEKAHAAGLGVMLHMPMQPKSTQVDLEPQTIMTATPDAEIRRYLDEALAGVPHAEGVNNHMGSAATSDLRVMRTVLAHLKQKKLFFVDSNVIPASVAAATARRAGIPVAKRDVFIDNEMKPGTIRYRLLQAKKTALLKGRVVVIGHDKEMTLNVLRQTVPEIEKDGVRLVLVKELAQ